SWSWDEKGLKVRFVIRRGARFHDGKPVTSDDVLFTVEKLRSPYAAKSANAALPRQIKEAQAVDDRTVVFTLPGVDALGWSIIGGLVTQPRHDPYEAFQRNPLGAGPYRFVDWRPFESLTLEASPHWWDADEVQVKTIVRLVVPEPESRMAMLKSGQIDFMDEVQPRQGDELLKDKRFRVKVTDAGGWGPILFSTDRDTIPDTDIRNPFLDVRVRRAFIMALDRKAIFEGVALGKYGSYIPGPWSQFAVGAVENEITPYPYDPKEARRLLEEAKFPFDREFGIWYYRTSSGYPEAFEVAIAYWNAIGIKARPRLTEVGTVVSYANEFPSRTYPIRLYRVNGLSAEGEAPGYVKHSKVLTEGFNGQMVDPKLEAWGLQLRTAFEPADRERIHREMYKYLHEQALTIPLLGGVLIHAFNQRVDWELVPGQTTVTHLWRSKWLPGAP
ncbi:MAG: ABC transporter substrate-binding protein, partial [SAR202 cluster bacterium]|nr:ABC transporter substrate-binding protein [SAR202 cluster bacterium]